MKSKQTAIVMRLLFLFARKFVAVDGVLNHLKIPQYIRNLTKSIINLEFFLRVTKDVIHSILSHKIEYLHCGIRFIKRR